MRSIPDKIKYSCLFFPFIFLTKNRPKWLLFQLKLVTLHSNIKNSTFANGEVKELKEVREVKAICFTAKSSTQKAVGYNF
nr:hypothetical protein [Prevotella sp.]